MAWQRQTVSTARLVLLGQARAARPLMATLQCSQRDEGQAYTSIITM